MTYYKLAIYGTNEAVADDSAGFISLANLGAGVPGAQGSLWIEIECEGAGAKIEQSEPEIMIGGFLRQSTDQRMKYSIRSAPLAHPDDTASRMAVYKVFGKRNIFLAASDYDAPELIAADGYAVRIAGIVDTEDIYEDGSKILTLNISRSEPERG